MPFLIVAPLTAALTSTLGATLAAVVANVVALTLSIAVSFGLSAISSALTGKPKSPLGAFADRTTPVRQPITVRRIVYGELRLSGPITFLLSWKEYNAFTEEDESILGIMLTLSTHELEDIGEIYFGDELVTLNEDGTAFGKWAGYVTFKRGLGIVGGDSDFHTFVQANSQNKWTVNHKQEGCGKIYGLLKFNRDVFPSGLPNISCRVRGRKVYDDRTGLTTYSTNTNLCVRDYITDAKYGIGDPSINETLSNVASNVCDEAVTVAGRQVNFTIFHLTTPVAAPSGSGNWSPTRAQPAGSLNWIANIGSSISKYEWAYTFVDDTGETLPSPALVIANVKGAPQAGLRIFNIALGGEGCTARKLYRTVKNGSQLKLVTTINDNVTTQYSDNLLDASLGANAPVTETTLVHDDIRVPEEHDLLLLETGLPVAITTDGTLPSPLTATTYYVIRTINATFKLATSKANALANIFVDITTVGTGTHTMEITGEVRYTCNGTIDVDQKPKEALQALLTGMMGDAIYQGGFWNLYAGAYTAPTVTIDEDDMDGPIEGNFLASKRDVVNGVKGVFVNPLEFFQPVDFPPVTNATYLAQDQNKKRWADLNLPFTTSGSMAQRIAKIELEKSRQQITITIRCKLTAFEVQAGEVIKVSYEKWGWVEKHFRIIEWRLVPRQNDTAAQIGVDLLCKETASGIYDWNVGEETKIDLAPNTELPDPFDIAPSGDPNVVEELYETTGSAGVKSRAHVTWTPSPDATVVKYQLECKPFYEETFHVIADIRGLEYDLNDLEAGLYDVRIKAFSARGVGSVYSSEVRFEIVGLSAPPEDVENLVVSVSSGLALATWDLSPDLDVQINGEVIIRHTPVVATPKWEDGRVVGVFNGGSVNGYVEAIAGTYMAKFKDSTGNFSTAMVSFEATEGIITGFSTVYTSTQQTGFAGTKTNVTLASDKISITDTSSSLIGTYEFDESGNAYKDLTTIKARRFVSDIELLCFVDTDLIDSRENVDDWADVDGGSVDGCDVTLFISLTDDDPSGSPTWSDWIPFINGEFTSRAFKLKLELKADAEENNVEVSKLVVVVKEAA